MSGYSCRFKPGPPLEFDIKRTLWREIGNFPYNEFHPALAMNSVSAQPTLVDLSGDSDRWHGDSSPHSGLNPSNKPVAKFVRTVIRLMRTAPNPRPQFHWI